MSRIRTLGVAALVMALAVTASSARAADDTKKKEHAGVHGVVVKVEKDADKDTGSFTIKAEEKKAKGTEAKTADAPAAKADEKKATDVKANDAPAAEETKFMVTADTKFVKVAHKKKSDTADAKAEPESTPATFGDLKEGEHVEVEAKGGVALSVKIHEGHKKKPV